MYTKCYTCTLYSTSLFFLSKYGTTNITNKAHPIANKKPNTIKSVHFTSLKQGPMGDAVIEGYINNNKEDEFVAFASSEDNFQFQGDMIESKKVSNLIKYQTKTPDEIKKDLDKKKNAKDFYWTTRSII